MSSAMDTDAPNEIMLHVVCSMAPEPLETRKMVHCQGLLYSTRTVMVANLDSVMKQSYTWLGLPSAHAGGRWLHFSKKKSN